MNKADILGPIAMPDWVFRGLAASPKSVVQIANESDPTQILSFIPAFKPHDVSEHSNRHGWPVKHFGGQRTA